MITDEQKQQEAWTGENPNQTITSDNKLEKRMERRPNTHLHQVVDDSWLCPTTTQQRNKETIMEELQSEDKVISDQTAKQTAKRFKNKASSLTRHINETTIMEQEEECDPSISLEDHHKDRRVNITKERHCSCVCAANLPSPPVNSSVQKIPTTVLKSKDFEGDRNKELSGSNMELEGRMESKLAGMRQMSGKKVFSCHSRKNESNDKTAIEVGKEFRSWVRSRNRGAN